MSRLSSQCYTSSEDIRANTCSEWLCISHAEAATSMNSQTISTTMESMDPGPMPCGGIISRHFLELQSVVECRARC